ncbi:uncharacterized protein BJ171DRAFT_506784 [Polychytrium aggregatum]|uniref:uncharacterized protein n=1 Tax=Polychytrium aggregatum TaxID=110093 RepID=UPI0022FE4A5E|nr:uncharacterized protein BJ171DRAFT_506784 [Polychytrium aggregatum]KAI9204254.1 hypothetical protein BJ171DRAFT_506784 [Polychytrium aggregatum]
MNNICVFCGSSDGVSPVYTESARQLGNELVRRNIGLVYGAGHLGLMGTIAKTVANQGGKVLGIIPTALSRFGNGLNMIGETIEVKDMHSRKKLMADRSDAFIALPGGYGTFEELLETITWSQLNIHSKPIGILNTNGFYTHLIAMIDHAVAEGFIRPQQRSLVIVHEDPVKLLDALASYTKTQVSDFKLDWSSA